MTLTAAIKSMGQVSAGRDGGASGDGCAQGGQTPPHRESRVDDHRRRTDRKCREIEDLLAAGINSVSVSDSWLWLI